MKNPAWFIACLALATIGCGSTDSSQPVNLQQRLSEFVFLPQNGGQNLLSFREVDLNTGALSPPQSANVGQNPVMAKVHPFQPLVYVANRDSSNISAFRFDPDTRSLNPLPGSPFATVAGVSSLAIHPNGRFLFSAGATQARTHVLASDGSLQNSGTPVAIPEPANTAPSLTTRSGDTLYIPCGNTVLGTIQICAVNNDTGQLGAATTEPLFGTEGVLGLGLHPTLNVLYAACEGPGNSGRIGHFQINANGNLTPQSLIAVNTDCGLLSVRRNGDFFVGTSGNNVLGCITDNQTGTFAIVTQTAVPRPTPVVALDPTHLFLFGTSDTSVQVSQPQTGASLSNTVEVAVTSPTVPDFLQILR